MNPGILCSAIIINCWWVASAETNSASMTLSFVLPTTQLRCIAPERAQGTNATEPQPQHPETNALQSISVLRWPTLDQLSSTEVEPVAADSFSVSVRGSDLEMQVCRRLEDGGYLTRPEPETPLTHFLDRTFSPEVIHLGRNATASCTLYTAIVRKNPLCLLNPMFLFISW